MHAHGHACGQRAQLFESLDAVLQRWVSSADAGMSPSPASSDGSVEEEERSLDPAIISSLPQRVIRGDALLFDDPQPGFADGWKVEARHNGLDPQDLTGYAICVNPV